MNREKIHENIFCVYRHIRLDTNQPFYIGIGELSRASFYKGRNNYWKNIYKKCNKNIKIDILFENLTWEKACEKEIEFIKLYGRKDKNLGYLVNMTDGGEGGGGYKHTQETKNQIRNIILGRKDSDLVRDKKSQAKKNNDQNSKIKCIWCFELSDPANSKRNHFNNCPHNPNYIARVSRIEICIHCCKSLDFRNIARWHNDNCKMNQNKLELIYD